MDISGTIERIKGKRVYIIGNGGSYANAQHIANDLLSKGVAAFTMDASFLTATANDFDYSVVFVRWLKVVAESGDVLIALSGSGRSPNILMAVDFAEKLGMYVIKVFGKEHGLDMQESEEEQIIWGHTLFKYL